MLAGLIIFILIAVLLMQSYYHQATHNELIEYKTKAEAERKAVQKELHATKQELDEVLRKLNEIYHDQYCNLPHRSDPMEDTF